MTDYTPEGYVLGWRGGSVPYSLTLSLTIQVGTHCGSSDSWPTNPDSKPPAPELPISCKWHNIYTFSSTFFPIHFPIYLLIHFPIYLPIHFLPSTLLSSFYRLVLSCLLFHSFHLLITTAINQYYYKMNIFQYIKHKRVKGLQVLQSCIFLLHSEIELVVL